eukprot:9407230-Ditylum_brightwellii.AAC.2
MGNSWMKDESCDETKLDKSGFGILKLASQRIVKLSGKINKWQRWKNWTLCAFVGSGDERVLVDPYEVAVQPSANAIVYFQLAVAMLGRTAYHIVTAFE